MAELPDLHKITAAQTLRMLTLQEAQLRELTERVRLQDELLEATVNALATICEQLPGDAPEVAANLRDLMFDRKKRIDQSPL
jgi:uncharacterized protein (DUF3084 family)